MTPILYLLALITFISTLTGGLAAIKFKHVLQYFFAFSSGTLIAITFFDVLPESLSIAASADIATRSVMIAVVGAFLFFSFLERFFLTHHHHEEEEHGHIMGPVGATGLIVHSCLDGVAIGMAYQVNSSMGILVALAVISHDFTDGINTVIIMLNHRQTSKSARIFLFVDAIAPVFGILLTSFFAINDTVLCIVLAAFSGQFLYLGATSLLPETYKHNPLKMGMSMVLGILVIFGLSLVI